MVGKNNSWFVPEDRKSQNSLRILKGYVLTKDYFVTSGSTLANRLNAQIKKIGSVNSEAKYL